MLPTLYTPEQVAESLHVTVRWLEDRARRRLIPHARTGRRLAFTAEQVQQIIEVASVGVVADEHPHRVRADRRMAPRPQRTLQPRPSPRLKASGYAANS